MKNSTDLTKDLIRHYLENFAVVEPDPFCPELIVSNTDNISAVWKYVCDLYKTGSMILPYWSIVWPGGRALARHILDNPGVVAGKRVLEIGSGSGIATIAAARAGAVASGMDLDPAAAELARYLSEINQVNCEWITGNAFLSGADISTGYDLVIAADIFYEQPMSLNAELFLRRTSASGVPNIVADPREMHRPKSGLRVIKTIRVPVCVDIEGIRERDVCLLEILP